ncbi:MAG: ATP synthase F0 subunit B [Deltaproteobacteria bacterium]|nr:ATP synthase F0 subunit B [Deltaproteobacteria bacterium]MBW1990778.1 ATP synthase F0 subunit B [Deltaproteobacteria bacterium]
MKRAGRVDTWWLMALLAAGAWLVLAGAAWGAEAAHGEHGGITPEKIQDLIWRTFNFLVFASILVYLLAKKFPVKDFFHKRTEEIAQSLSELEARKAAAAKALEEAQARLAQVAAEREQIIQQFVEEGQLEKAKIIEKAEMVAARIKEMAALSIAQETKKAAQQLKQEVATQAAELAEELIKKKITPADQQRLVDEYLEKVVEKH